MDAALPTRAAAALSEGEPLPLAGGGRLFLHPFSLRRNLVLHSIESPLFVPDGRFGVGLGWCATLMVLAEEDAAAVSRRLAEDGAAAFVDGSVEWAEARGVSFEDIANAAVAIKRAWLRMTDLDRPEKRSGEEVTPAGEASRPGTATSPASSATPSTPGTGAATPPSTPPSAP